MKYLKSIKEMADINVKCKNCEGSGIIQCWLCEGRGESEVYRGTYEDCSECSKGNQICVHCNGSGKEVDSEKALKKFDDELEVNYKKELQTLYNRRKSELKLIDLRRFNEYNNNLYENAINILNNVKDLEYSDSKLPFSESEYKFFNKSIKKFKGDATFNNGKYHEEVPSPYKTFNTVKFIKDNFFNNSNPKLCDLGCGIGSVLEFSKKIGYDVSGVEYKRDFIEIHDELKLDVKYGDFFEMDLTFLNNMDVIYLYRPISDINLADKLLDIIYKNTKDDVIIVYVHPPNMYSGTKEYNNYLVFGTQFMVKVLVKNIKSNINELYHIQ